MKSEDGMRATATVSLQTMQGIWQQAANVVSGRTMRVIAIIGGAMLLTVAACSGDESRPPTATASSDVREIQPRIVSVEGGETYMDVSANDLATMMAEKDFMLVNVHVPYEGEIEGTDLFIPYDQAAQSQDTIPADLDSKIVVYCRSGSMSAIASSALVGLGYTNVWNLDRGMIAWEQAGYSLVDKAR